MNPLLRVPLFVVLLGLAGLAMLVPAAVAATIDDFTTARPFFYGGILTVLVASFLGLATLNATAGNRARSNLLSLLAAFTFLPVVFALPVSETLPDARFLNLYVEMVSCFTTTGAAFFEPDRLPMAIHLWRALVGWLGGLLIWVTAFAVLAPMSLGGFEVTSTTEAGRGAERRDVHDTPRTSGKILRHAQRLTPVYAGLTVILWTLLVLAGDPPAISAMHAMSTLSTSGITPLRSFETLPGGWVSEAVVAVFFLFAITRRSFEGGFAHPKVGAVARDRELRVALIIVGGVTGLLFLRHWLGAWEVDNALQSQAIPALWGTFFTLSSFLTTTGFVSGSWDSAQGWSGLGTTGLLLAGMAVFGGGVATTAGGVKLLRVYALYKQTVREMERLVHPHSVGGQGETARRIRREGAAIAWVFFMLFAMSLALIMAALSLTGLGFEQTIVLAVAALSTAGPVALVAAEVPIVYGDLPDAAKLVLSAAMVLGRLETLVIIALLNPDFWRA